jgi:hypothetical protein
MQQALLRNAKLVEKAEQYQKRIRKKGILFKMGLRK